MTSSVLKREFMFVFTILLGCVFVGNTHSDKEQVLVVSGRGRFKRSEPAFLRLGSPPRTRPGGSVAQKRRYTRCTSIHRGPVGGPQTSAHHRQLRQFLEQRLDLRVVWKSINSRICWEHYQDQIPTLSREWIFCTLAVHGTKKTAFSNYSPPVIRRG